MTKAIIEPAEPWGADGGSAEERRLGELFRAVANPDPLPAATLARVHARLRGRRAISALSRRMREAVMAFVMLIAGSSFALAGWGAHDWWQAHARTAARASAAALVASDAKRRLRTSAPRGAPVAAAPDSTPSPLSAAPSATPALPAPVGSAVASSRAAAPSSDPSTLAAETAALERVLFKLRREHDAAGALALLDQSQALFAHSTLALEAQVARVDALLALGKREQALAVLDHLPLSQVGRGGELRVLRAELRAKDDCARALADFDVLVTQSLSAPLAERALYGRAACEVQVGDSSHARSDFSQYLSRFPNGRFAAAAQHELTRSSGKAASP